jgi:hypothetical protein
MKTLRIPLIALSLALLALAGSAENVSASRAACSEDYLLCLNDALALEAISEELGSIECAASWIGCTVSKLRFW